MTDEEFVRKFHEAEDDGDVFDLLVEYFEELLATGWPDTINDPVTGTHDGAWIEIANKGIKLMEKALDIEIPWGSNAEVFMKNIAIAAQKFGAKSGRED